MDTKKILIDFKTDFETYFQGFFVNVKWFESDLVAAGKAIGVQAHRNGNKYDWSYNTYALNELSVNGTFHHLLENMKGDVIRYEEGVLLPEHLKK